MLRSLDPTDRNILRQLQEDGRLTNAELAERVGLSPTPCLRRVKALEDSGVIAGYRAELDRGKLDLGLTVMVGVKIDGHRDENATAIQLAFNRMPEVVSCHLISGDADFLLEAVLPDLQAYETFLLGKLLKLPMVKDVRSNFVIRTVKSKGSLPLTHL
ncbi:MAG TPA: Lrp/AsnC family transcriptional regulator [Rhodoblastus sp.]|nr:Lrp/AsnC family transcriptional regulator [Rhodoblastus sp.]